MASSRKNVQVSHNVFVLSIRLTAFLSTPIQICRLIEAILLIICLLINLSVQFWYILNCCLNGIAYAFHIFAQSCKLIRAKKGTTFYVSNPFQPLSQLRLPFIYLCCDGANETSAKV